MEKILIPSFARNKHRRKEYVMKYEKPDMKVYSKKTIAGYEECASFMKEKGIGKTVVCTGKGGISVDISQMEKNQRHK